MAALSGTAKALQRQSGDSPSDLQITPMMHTRGGMPLDCSCTGGRLHPLCTGYFTTLADQQRLLKQANETRIRQWTTPRAATPAAVTAAAVTATRLLAAIC